MLALQNKYRICCVVASCKLQGVFIFQLDDFKVLESIQKSIQKSITTNAALNDNEEGIV